MSAPQTESRLALIALIAVVAALAQLACAPARGSSWDPDHPFSVELYRRPAPAVARIPGEASTDYRYATSEVPIKLTASDGTGLILRSLEVEAVIDEPASLTELRLSFENPHDQVLDGRFELLLPRGAEISRFAMMVGGRWIESEIVERERARAIYSDHKHIQRDPAIFERERGRRFSGRIFPIAPRERKQIILSYTTLHDRAQGVFRVPLAGLPRVDELDVQVTRRTPGAEPEHFELHSEHEAPRGDFELALEGASNLGVALNNEALLRVVPIPLDSTNPPESPGALSVLVDTSASMAGLAEASDQALAGLLDALSEAGLDALPIEILAFDQGVHRIHRGTIGDAREPTLAALRVRARLGASDLVAALDAVDPSAERLLLISDGEISAGVDSRYGLAEALARAADRGLGRLDALVLGSEAHLEQLEFLVFGERLRAGVVVDATRAEPSAWVEELLSPPAAPVEIAVAGAKQVWPERFTGLRPGQAVLVHADFGRRAPARAKLTVSGALSRSETLALEPGEGPLIARSIALLRVKALMAEIAAGATEATQQRSWRELVELSKEHRILNDYTSLLVLESDRAYTEFGIARGDTPALTLSPGPQGSQAATMGMEQAKNLPVGSDTTRDFTAVIDISPVASRDAAGISLAGSSGAETHYTTGSEPLAKYGKRWRVRSKGRTLGARDKARPAAIDDFTAELDGLVQRCAHHALAQYARDWEDELPRHPTLELALRFDKEGRIVELRAPSDAGMGYVAMLHTCTRYLLPELATEALDLRPARTAAAHELLRSYELDLQFSYGQPPADWWIPEVAVFASDAAFAGRVGVSGWAKLIAEDLDAGLIDEALDVAWTWHRARPNDTLPYVSLGHALLAAGRGEDAARAYGSLIDLEPTRAEARRFAGALLESLETTATLELAIDSYRKARAIRPDQPTSYQALALALARHGELHAAVKVLVDALGRTYTAGRYGGAVELMREELACLSAAAILADPASRSEVLAQLVDTMVIPEATPRDWLSLSWESDASHLSLQVRDLHDELGFYHWELSSEVSNGYGPQGLTLGEDFEGPMRAWLKVEDLGPEGVAMGSLRRVRFDGVGGLSFETRPFVIWPGRSTVGLGTFEREPRLARAGG